ncbi:MAG: hypothetical protein QXR19_08575 [Candidatus Jordarchaeaceae archaeon]
MKTWSDSRLDQAVENCLKHIQSFPQERGISIEMWCSPFMVVVSLIWLPSAS